MNRTNDVNDADACEDVTEELIERDGGSRVNSTFVGNRHPTSQLVGLVKSFNHNGKCYSFDLGVMHNRENAVVFPWVDEDRGRERYERSYGVNQDSLGGYLDDAIVAKAIRSGLREALKREALPGVKKVSVRQFNGSVNVYITYQDGYNPYLMPKDSNLSEKVYFDPCDSEPMRFRDAEEPYVSHRRLHMTREAGETLDAIEALCDSFNSDGSDMMSDYLDVGFCGSVDIEYEQSSRFYEERQRAIRSWVARQLTQRSL